MCVCVCVCDVEQSSQTWGSSLVCTAEIVKNMFGIDRHILLPLIISFDSLIVSIQLDRNKMSMYFDEVT